MTVYTDEIFGPVLWVVRADTYEEGLALINDNPYANGTAIFTRDGGAARRFQFDVEVGMVGINVPIPVPGRVLLLRRLEGLAVRRHPHVRPRGHQLLHARQGRDLAVARPGDLQRRPRLPAHPMRTADVTRRSARHRLQHRLAHRLRRIEARVRRDDRAHVFHSWSAQGQIDPLPIAARLGLVLLGLRGQALPRLLLPAGQRQHRLPAPQAGRRDPGAGRPAVHDRARLRQRRPLRGGPAHRRARPG